MATDGMPAARAAANASGGTSPTTSDGRIERRSVAFGRHSRVEVRRRTPRRRRTVSASSSRRLSIWTTPVSHSVCWKSTGARSVRSKIHRFAPVRTTIGMSGRRSRRALMISISRDAWPKPWPEMYQTMGVMQDRN